MPGFHEEFRILTIANRLPTRRKNLLDHRFRENLVGSYSRYSIDARSESFCRAKRVCCVVARNIYADRLRSRILKQSCQNERK